MGLIRKAASILTLGGGSDPARRGSHAKAARAEAWLAETEAIVAQEQAAVITRALHEDEAHRRADLEEVAEQEAEAVPWSRQSAPGAGVQAAPDRKEHSSLPLPGYNPRSAAACCTAGPSGAAAHAA